MRAGIAALAAAALAGPGMVHAQDGQETGKPLFEIGVGAGVGYIPDYPAADQSHIQGAVLPYVIYRGDFLRADRDGVQGRIYRSDRVTFEFSLEGALGSSADDNDARQGMPDIDLRGEIGPGLRVNLHRASDRRERVDLTIPLRGVFSTDFSGIEYRGLVFAPEIAYAKYGFLGEENLLQVSAGPIFATSHLMDYYYQVEPRYALADRPAYDAHAGYLGSRIQMLLNVPLTRRISAFGAFRGELFSGSAADDSPLYKRDVNLSIGGGITVSFYSSTGRSTAAEDLLN